MSIDQEAGEEWSFWAAGRRSWGCERCCRQTEIGRRNEGRRQTHAPTAEKRKLSYIRYIFHPRWFKNTSNTLILNICYLNDEEECWGRIKSTIVKIDDGGAMWTKKVSNLKEVETKQHGIKVFVWWYWDLEKRFCYVFLVGELRMWTRHYI